MKERFIVQYRLKMQPFQEHILNKRFEIGRRIYNALAHVTLNRYQEMKKRKNIEKLLKNEILKLSTKFGRNLALANTHSIAL